MVKTVPKISFCLTEEELRAIDAARQRLAINGILRNRSEVIRAAILMLLSKTDAELAAEASVVTQLKPGRKSNPG